MVIWLDEIPLMRRLWTIAGVALPLVLFWVLYNIRADQRRTLWHGGPVESLCFSPDGRLLASASRYEVKLWDVSKRTLRASSTKHDLSSPRQVFSTNGALLVGSGVNGDSMGRITKRETATDKEVVERVTDRRDAEITALSTDEKMQATAGWRSKRSVRDSPTSVSYYGISYSVSLWDISTGRLRRTVLKNGPEIWWLALSPDSKTLVTGGQDRVVRFWNTKTGRLSYSLSGIYVMRGPTPAFSKDGTAIAIGTSSDVELRDVTTGTLKRRIPGFALALAFSPDGKILASGVNTSNCAVTLWDVATGKPSYVLTAHKYPVSALAFSPDGKTLASGSGDNTVKLWAMS